jgi:hypothetical protein
VTWYRVTVASAVYVRDPALHFVRDDGGRFLAPDQLLEEWCRFATVEQLPTGVDPEQVMREARRPSAVTRGGNLGMSARSAPTRR